MAVLCYFKQDYRPGSWLGCRAARRGGVAAVVFYYMEEVVYSDVTHLNYGDFL